MKKENLEIQVGIFVIAAVGLLTLMVVKAGDFYLKPGYMIRFVFGSVSGIEQGSPVRLAGVEIGEVTDVGVMRSGEGLTQVQLMARITQGIEIEEDAQVRVASSGLLGEKYIEIMPSQSGAALLSDGGLIVGKGNAALQDLANQGSQLLTKLDFAMDHINEVVGDAEFKRSVKGTFVNGEQVALNLKEATEDLKETMKAARVVMTRLRDGEGTIGKLLISDKIARDLEAFVEDIKKHPWKLFKRY